MGNQSNLAVAFGVKDQHTVSSWHPGPVLKSGDSDLRGIHEVHRRCGWNMMSESLHNQEMLNTTAERRKQISRSPGWGYGQNTSKGQGISLR